MFQSQKHVFWQALLITIIIFSLGVIAGFVLENWRNNKVSDLYKNSEVELLDVRLQSDIYSLGKFNCNNAVNENMKFADRIYLEAQKMERYQKANLLTEDLKIVHEKYDLLRATLLLNSIKIREKCNVSYSDVVYFYKYNNPGIEISAKETVFSKLLGELKERQGNKILLIPLAADGNLTSVDLLLEKYGVSKEELPVVLINSKIKINQLEKVSDIERFLS